jgi:hypothetical protein
VARHRPGHVVPRRRRRRRIRVLQVQAQGMNSAISFRQPKQAETICSFCLRCIIQ